MTFESVMGLAVVIAGVALIMFHNAVLTFFAASSYLVGETFGDESTRSMRPGGAVFVGVCSAAFGAIMIYQGAATSRGVADQSPAPAAKIIFFAFGVLAALLALGVMIARRWLARWVAARLHATGGDRFAEPDVDGYAKVMVRVFAAWFLTVGIIAACAAVFLIPPV